MDLLRRSLVVVVMAMLSGTQAGAAASEPASSVPASISTSEDPSASLRKLLDASDESFLDRNPMYGVYRGDLRRAAQHGDYVSAAYVAAERRAAQEHLERLATISRERLPKADQVAYDSFRWSLNDSLELNSDAAAAIWPRLKLDQLGWQIDFAVLSSGEGVAPYRSVADYDNGLARIDGFIAYLDRVTARMREGMVLGIVQPRVVVDRLIVQFDDFAAQGLDTSPYYGPIRKLPADIDAAERERLTKAYAAAIDERLRPAFRRVRDFLVKDYRPAARDSVGLGALPGGAAYYAYLVRSTTTTTLTVKEIHELGLAEVQRITAAMRSVMKQVGYDGTLQQFFEHLRTDPAFQPASAAALADGYRKIGERVDARLPQLFAQRPRTALEIRPTPDFSAPTDAGARYNNGAPDIGRPGVFYYNTYDLPSRSMFDMETLYLHEAVPGHHMQTMLAIENAALPKQLRFGGNTAYNEGWALYAESLGPELGLFEDPYQRFGHYNDEMLRAMRLVVDTGLHAYGWSRERAIDYMLAHSAMSRTDVTAEVERYLVWPAQALAYKVGELTIRRLRQRAEAAQGEKFDLRAFHTEVLMTGSIPMAVLEAKIDDWIAASRSSAAGN